MTVDFPLHLHQNTFFVASVLSRNLFKMKKCEPIVFFLYFIHFTFWPVRSQLFSLTVHFISCNCYSGIRYISTLIQHFAFQWAPVAQRRGHPLVSKLAVWSPAQLCLSIPEHIAEPQGTPNGLSCLLVCEYVCLLLNEAELWSALSPKALLCMQYFQSEI